MNCEYFFSCNKNDECKCENCIYSDFVMNKREKTLILSYLYNNYTRLEQQLRQLQFNVRYRFLFFIKLHQMQVWRNYAMFCTSFNSLIVNHHR